MSELRTPYPEIEPFDAGRLQVSSVHELYYEQCGNAAGKPVVFLHGGQARVWSLTIDASSTLRLTA